MIRYALLLILLAQPAYAAGDDKAVTGLMELARERITQAHLSDGSNVPPETAEEKKTPIIPIEDGRRVVDMGQRSAVADWCSIDYHPYYMRFMQAERAKKKWSDKQIAYIGFLHGFTVGASTPVLKEKGPCSEKQAKHIQDILDKGKDN